MRRYILCIFIIVMLIPFASANVVGKNINRGAIVFIGEEGLNISAAVGDSDYIGWKNGSDLFLQQIRIKDRKLSFDVSQSEFSSKLGPWYRIKPGTDIIDDGKYAFYINDPTLELKIYNRDTGNIIDNGKIISGTKVRFEINTNMYSVKENRFPVNPSTDGFISIKFMTDSGATYIKLPGSGVSLENIFTNDYKSNWDYWDTSDIFDLNTYVISAESNLNNMKNNYNYIGKTVSTSKTLSIISNTVSISTNKASVVRSNPFSVTINGNPNNDYCVWVSKTSGMSATISRPPSIQSDQEGVNISNPICKNHKSSSKEIEDDVPPSISPNPFYALVTTDNSGARTISFSTALNTASKKYTIRVEENTTTSPKYDEIEVNVINGGISIVSVGGSTYYMGEIIELSGVNTESYTTYLYIYGPNLNTEGERLDEDASVINNITSNFTKANTNGGGTWSWNWHLSDRSLDAGTYTIYAVSQPKSRTHLIDTAYSTTSINLKKPTISATASQKSVAKGDVLHITGFAEGDPSEIAIWIMGKNYPYRYTESPDSDGSFDFELTREQTSKMSSGQYYVIVQHPMQNGKFDIVLNGKTGFISNLMLGNNGTNGTQIFKFSGTGSLQGTDAANALITAIEDANIDDMYTKLQFSIADPYLKIDTIGMKYLGDQIIVTGETNLGIGTPLIIDVVPLVFRPTNKSISYGTSDGAIMNSVVIKGGDTNNKFFATIGVSTFTPDEYLVTVSAVGHTIVDTESFTLSGEKRPASQIPTQQITTPAIIYQTVVPTAVITQTPISVVPTKKAPGYGAILALVGLIIVATIIVRRE